MQVRPQGKRFLGVWLGGTPEDQQRFYEAKAADWAGHVNLVAAAAEDFPHEAYYCLYRCVQAQWTYALRTSSVASGTMQPVEDSLAQRFLPRLVGAQEGGLDRWRRDQAALRTCDGGLGIPDPTKAQQMGDPSRASREGTRVLVNAIRTGARYNRPAHHACVQVAAWEYQERRRAWADSEIARLIDTAESAPRSPPPLPPPGLALVAPRPEVPPVWDPEHPPAVPRFPKQWRTLARARELRAGTKYNIPPRQDNHHALAKDEFIVTVCTTLGCPVPNRPERCDGCGKQWSEEHAGACAKGYIPTIRHNEVQDAFERLLRRAGFPVRLHPMVGERGATRIGDHEVRGLLNPQTDCVVDYKFMDLNCPSYLHRDAAATLGRKENQVKDDYADAVRVSRRDIAAVVVTAEGGLSQTAQQIVRICVGKIARKTQCAPSRVAGVVRAELQLAIARAHHLALRRARSRGPVGPPPDCLEDGPRIRAIDGPNEVGDWE